MRIRANEADGLLFGAVIALLAVGTLMVMSASSAAAEMHFNDSLYFLKRQLVWAALGIILMLSLMQVDYHRWQRWAAPLFLATIALLVLVLVPSLGKTVNGARRWIGAGGFYVQPSELSKYATALYMAVRLTQKEYEAKKFFKGMVPLLIILGIVFALILKEPDLGTALAISGTFFLLLFMSGSRLYHLGALFLLGIGGVVALILSEPYRLRRLISFSDPWSDPLNTGYHVIQSLYALGSGGFFGAGFGMSREKFLYLPEPHTDFIFAVLGEEFGILGTLAVVFLFAFVAWRGLLAALHAPDMYGTLLAAGIVMTIFLQAAMNIAVVTASMPVTGIPLPFVSFGGSALVVTMGAVGILLNISGHAK